MKLERANFSEERLVAGDDSEPPKFRKSLQKVHWLPLREISIVWPQAQRELNEKRAKAIADALDPELFGVINVALPNKHGVHHIIDGQHRCAAARAVFGEDNTVPCLILEIDNAEDAAKAFDELNTGRKAPDAIDTFKVRVTAEHETYVAVNDIVEGAGYKVGGSPTDGTIRAISALLAVYKSFGGDVLRKALLTIRDTWGKDINAMAGPIIFGYGAFLAQHGADLDRKRLTERVEKKYTPGRLLGAAQTAMEVNHSTKGKAVAHVIRETYNQGLRTGRLMNGKDE